jgi:hypothetical protein
MSPVRTLKLCCCEVHANNFLVSTVIYLKLPTFHVFCPKVFTHFSNLPCVPHAQSISCFYISYFVYYDIDIIFATVRAGFKNEWSGWLASTSCNVTFVYPKSQTNVILVTTKHKKKITITSICCC